jgi:hypothetical protein
MGEWYSAVVDPSAEQNESEDLGKLVVNRLSSEEIINPVLENIPGFLKITGYRPGKRIPQIYNFQGNYQFWNNTDNIGMEVVTKKWVNSFGILFLEEMSCPQCCTQHTSSTENITKDFVDAMGKYLQGDSTPLITCPSCHGQLPVKEWKTKPHLGFSNLTFVFWNWPPFDKRSWKIDITKLISDALNHPTVFTWGKI